MESSTYTCTRARADCAYQVRRYQLPDLSIVVLSSQFEKTICLSLGHDLIFCVLDRGPNSVHLLFCYSMKLQALVAAGLIAAATSLSIARGPDQAIIGNEGADDDDYLIELAPGETRWIKEDEKWELRRVCISL